MAAVGTETVSYDDWSQGEFGDTAPDRAAEGSWTGTNVVVYKDGHIGPRPGIRAADIGTALPNGALNGFGFVPTPLDTEPSHWVILGDEVWLFRPDNVDAAKTSTDLTTALTSGEFVWWKESTRQLFGEVHFATPNEVYRLKMNTADLTEISGAANDEGGNDIETYKERLLVASATTTTRIWVSNAADFDTWDVEDYFDVGASWPVNMMVEFRDGLAIFTPGGNWLLTGAQPTSYTLRRISDALPPRPFSVVKTNEDMFYIPSARSAPIQYDGSYGDEDGLRHLETWKALGADVTGIQSYGNRDLLFLSEDGDLLWRKNGVWTKHTLGQGVGPYLARNFDSQALLAKDGDASNPAEFFYLNMDVERPAFTSDGSAQPGDGTDTPLEASFRLPDYFHPRGADIRVRRVIIDFTKYDTGASGTNNITASVSALARFRLPGSEGSVATASWNEAVTEGSEAGIRDRAVLKVGQSGWAGGYRLALSDIRGVKIDRVLVDIETKEGRPRS